MTRIRHPATEATPEPLPDWWEDDDAPLVYVSFGSVAATFPAAVQVYASALDAVHELPVRVLLTRGGNEIELGDVPANVHVEEWVSEPDVLGHASAAVGHGGTGTTLSALAAGCPLVVVPLFGDQPYNGARVAVAGAGVVAWLDEIGSRIELVLGGRSLPRRRRGDWPTRCARYLRSTTCWRAFSPTLSPERGSRRQHAAPRSRTGWSDIASSGA